MEKTREGISSVWIWVGAFAAFFILGLIGVSLWLENTNKEEVQKPLFTERLKNDKDRVESLIKVPGGIISSSTSGRLVYGDAESDEARVIDSGDPIMRIAALDDRLVMATRDRGDIIIYSRDLKQSEKIFTFPDGSINCLSVSKQGKILAGDYMGRLMVYDTSGKQILNNWGEETFRGVCGFVGEDILILNRSNEVLFSKFPYNSLSKAVELSDVESLDSGQISPTGRYLVARNSTVNGIMDAFVLYDLKNYRVVKEIPAGSDELTWGFSPDGKLFLTGNAASWKLIDTESGDYKKLNFGANFTAGVFTGNATVTLASSTGELKDININQF